MNEDLRLEIRLSSDVFAEELKTASFSLSLFEEKEGDVLNISKSGMSIIVRDLDFRKYSLGKPVVIKFYSENLKLKAKIIYITKTSENEAKIGFEFFSSKGNEQLSKIIEKYL